MVILPFTRPHWHLKGLFLFGFGSFWMGYWGWYSVTGLYFADLAIHPVLNAEFKAGYKVREDWHIPYWAAAIASIGVGIAFKYTFIVRPQFMNSLLVLHPYLDLAEGTTRSEYADMGPYARLDDWLIIVGILIVVELFSTPQWLLSFKPLVWLGERSFSESMQSACYSHSADEYRQAFSLLNVSSSGLVASSSGSRCTSRTTATPDPTL